jgi:Tfp pilus assembly protein PilO
VKIQNRQNFLVVLTIAAAGLYVGVNFVLGPLEDWWSTRQAQVKALRENIKDGNGLIRREASLRDQWANMRTNSLAPVTSQAEQQFLTAMDGWSRASGATITSIMPQWKVESTNYNTLNCRVETEGELGTVAKFIYNIEKGPLAVRLDTIELSAHDTTGQQFTLGVEINGLALSRQ